MAAGLSTTNVANKFLDHLGSNTSWTMPAAIFVKLHTGDPGSAGANAAAAGSTTRVAADFSAAVAGAIALTGTAPQWTNGGASETLTHISVWDASTAGNFLWSATLTAPQGWVSTNTFTLTTLGVSITPLAA
jgi:hypothetical protein